MCRVSSQRTQIRRANSSSTRNVTSARLPIGVAHTASGISRAGRALDTAEVGRERAGDDGRPHARGYHSGPHGRGRQALPAVSRRPQEGQGPTPARRAPRRSPLARPDARRSAPSLGPLDRARRRRPASPRRSLGHPRLPLVREWRGQGERAASARCESPAREARPLAALRADDDPRDRHRRRTRAGPRATRTARTRSCSLHLDPGTHRISYLSIPRDLRVEIPGYGSSKINAANQIGGPALTLATVKALTGLPIDHVVVVDFDGFEELIDAIGGIEVNVPKPILSNRFDCPYKPDALRRMGGLALREGHAAHGRAAGARLLAHPRRTSSTRPTRTSRAATASRSSPMPSATRSRASARSSACRSWATSSRRRSRPTSRPGSCAQLGWVRFRSSRLAALPPRRRAELDRRRVGAPRLRGQRRRDLDVARPLGSPRRRRRGRSTAPAARGAS